MEDFDLIISSFLSQYGIRILSKDFKTMSWKEFASLLSGLSPDTALGRVVAIRAETDREVIKNFSKSQYQIWSGWRSRMAKDVSEKQEAVIYDALKRAFINMAGGETGG